MTNAISALRRSGRALLWLAGFGGLILSGWSAPAARSSIITAASPALSDVNAAISSAHAGDTVVVPAGSAAWNNNLVITKGIALVGAGIGKTNITSAYSTSADRLTEAGYLVVYEPDSPSADLPFRLSGFTFDLAGKCRGVFLVNRSTTAVNKIRVDHTRIIGGNSPFSIWGTVYGVADNNEWYGCYISIDGLDEATWKNSRFDFGTADNFYFEDNRFIATSTVDAGNRSEMGARWCFRYNVIDNSGITGGVYPVLDMHGNIPDAHLSAMGAEVYGNTITESGDGLCLLDQRGGKALVYDNDSITTGSVFTKVREENLDSDNPPASAPLSGQPQHVSDSYYWNNKKNGVKLTKDNPYVGSTVDYGGSIGLVPKEDRDFWREKGSFNGTSGVGVGLKADRPAKCVKGVGYWATDEKILYTAAAADTWAAYYTPYAYPHPLTWPLSLISPKGGESWTVGSTHDIAWMANGYAGTVFITLLKDDVKVLDIGSADANASVFAWTIPAGLATGGGYKVRIFGGTNDAASADFSIILPPAIKLDKTKLFFGLTGTSIPAARNVSLTNSGGGTLNWTATSNAYWLTVSPASGTGSATLTVSVNLTGLLPAARSGSISVSDPADPASPHYITAYILAGATARAL